MKEKDKKFSYIFKGTPSELISDIRKNQELLFKEKQYDYSLFKANNDYIRLAVQRAGHGGGYYFDANLKSCSNETIVNGVISFHKNGSEISQQKKEILDSLIEILANILFGLLLIVFSIPILLFITYNFVVTRLIKREKKINYKKQRVDNLNIFFIDYLNCKSNNV